MGKHKLCSGSNADLKAQIKLSDREDTLPVEPEDSTLLHDISQMSKPNYFDHSNTLRSVRVAKDKLISTQNYLHIPIEYEMDAFKR